MGQVTQRLFAVLFGLAGIFSLTAAQSETGKTARTASKVTRYTDIDGRYTLTPPTGWTRSHKLPRPFAAWVGPSDDRFTPNLTVNLYGANVSPGDLNKIAGKVKIEHGIIYAQQATRLGGLPAQMWRTHLSVPDFPALENRQIITIHAGRVIELTFTCLASQQKKLDPVFDKVLASFTFAPETTVGKTTTSTAPRAGSMPSGKASKLKSRPSSAHP